MTSTSKGFTLAEVLIALGVLSVASLGLLALCAMGLKTSKKSQTTLTAAQVADRQLKRAINQAVVENVPAGARDRFWDQNYPYPTRPWSTGAEVVGSNSFSYAIYANTVAMPTTLADNRVKRVDIVVWWWTETGQREGYGRLQQQACRLINEEQYSP